jgi:hypothetical protein
MDEAEMLVASLPFFNGINKYISQVGNVQESLFLSYATCF